MNVTNQKIDTPLMVNKKLTIKQRKWLKVYTETGNATEAAMQSYDCKGNRETAAQLGYENIRKLDFTSLMDAVGLTDENLLKGLYEGRNATKPIVDPKTNTLKSIADHSVRHKYMDTAFKLKGRLSDKVELTGKDGEPLQIEMMAGIGFLNRPNDDKND